MAITILTYFLSPNDDSDAKLNRPNISTNNVKAEALRNNGPQVPLKPRH